MKGVYGGVVQSVKPYGVFVELEDGVVVMLHISQVSHGRVASTRQVFTEGQSIKAMILTRDSVVGHITLCTKKLEPTPGGCPDEYSTTKQGCRAGSQVRGPLPTVPRGVTAGCGPRQVAGGACRDAGKLLLQGSLPV